MEDVIGKDATAEWEKADHSNDAITMLKQYLVRDDAAVVTCGGNLAKHVKRYHHTKWILKYTSQSSKLRRMVLRFFYR